jgi:hypothetical protein
MDCSNGQHCDTDTHGCVANESDAGMMMSCSGNAECSGMAPVCDNGSCRACSLDDECESGVCRSDGACEVAANVLYVAPNAPSAGTCASAAAPCDLMYARTLVDAQRYSIRLANGTYALPTGFIVSSPIAHVTVIGASSAVFERSGSGPSFDVRSGSMLAIRGVTLHRGVECNTGTLDLERTAFNTPGSEVRSWVLASNCTTTVADSELDGSTAFGIDAINQGTLTLSSTSIRQSASDGVRAQLSQFTVTKSTIAQSMGMGVSSNALQLTIRGSTFYANRMGGISHIDGVFDITNNFVYRNGNAANSLFGGMRLDTSLAGNRVEHNTVVRNDAEYGATPVLAGGVYCRGGGTSANNLITNNFYGNESQTNAQTAGTCTFSGSLIVNSDAAVHFVRPVAEPFDYHLADAQSSAVNAGVISNPAVTDDFDGDPRDSTPDVGADELKP